MLDAFLLGPSHRLARSKESHSGNVCPEETLYAIRYKVDKFYHFNIQLFLDLLSATGMVGESIFYDPKKRCAKSPIGKGQGAAVQEKISNFCMFWIICSCCDRPFYNSQFWGCAGKIFLG